MEKTPPREMTTRRVALAEPSRSRRPEAVAATPEGAAAAGTIYCGMPKAAEPPRQKLTPSQFQ
jgi:hypothetical protein